MTVKQMAYNRSKRTQPIKYIVIHDTGNTGKGTNAESHYNYFNGGNRGASADFFVDSDGVWQVNDYYKYYTWHCGDGNGKYGITNNNSIGIEMCINSDGDYQKAYSNTIGLTKLLIAQLNISVDNVVRHYDASRKNCPATFNGNDRWYNFKVRLEMNNMIENAEQAIDKIISTGVDTDKKFWLTACEHVKYLSELFIKIANAM